MFSTRSHQIIALSVVVAFVVAGAVLAPVTVDRFLGGSEPGQDEIQFEETAASCGFEYSTSGNADGSGDGGVFVADADRDGHSDLLAIGGNRPVLFENTNGGFEQSGTLPDRDYPPLKSALFFDADGDGWQDLLLIPREGSPIFLSNQNGDYHDIDAGFNATLQWGTGATAADFDGDGSQEVFVIQNGDWREGTPRRGPSGEATDGYPNMLFDAGDDGQFERTDGANVAGTRWSLATAAADLSGNGSPDIYVANDYGYDVLLANEGNGTFARRTIPDTNSHGMATALRDVNGDGYLDVFITNIRFQNPQNVWALNSALNVRNTGNTLLLNRGNGTFDEQSAKYGIQQGGWGWAAVIEDFDNDRAVDIIHATQDYLRRSDKDGFVGVETRPALWEGTADGFERRNASAAGLVSANGRGLTTLDFDSDGDLDVAVADTSDQFKLYENRDDDGNWLQVRVHDDGPAIGAHVQVETNRGTSERVLHSRSNFFAQSTRTLHFGLGDATLEQVQVTWPNGTNTDYENIETNNRLIVHANGSTSMKRGDESGC